MQKIFANDPVHFQECQFCGAKITESPHEVWANISDDQIDWAIEDNEKMAKEAADFWDKQVDEFIEAHKDCQNR